MGRPRGPAVHDAEPEFWNRTQGVVKRDGLVHSDGPNRAVVLNIPGFGGAGGDARARRPLSPSLAPLPYVPRLNLPTYGAALGTSASTTSTPRHAARTAGSSPPPGRLPSEWGATARWPSTSKLWRRSYRRRRRRHGCRCIS